MNSLLVLNAAGLLTGGVWLWCGYVTIVFLGTFADETWADDRADDRMTDAAGQNIFYDAMLYAALPLFAINMLIYAHYFTSGDPLGLVQVLRFVGIGFESARDATGPISLLGATLGLGLFSAAAASNAAHELTHRTNSPAAMVCGRWLLAFRCDTMFAIDHVYGHHCHAGAYDDPTTARRGETLYSYLRRTLIAGTRSAIKIEAARLSRQQMTFWSVNNQILTGGAMSILLLCAFWFVGGGGAIIGFFLVAAQAKLHIEVNNYIAHYGLVRLPGSRVEVRHSWNVNRPISNAMLINLTRHSDHHLHGSRPYWRLQMEPDAPVIPHGYMCICLRAFFPPLWRSMMTPLLLDWDKRQATQEELDYLLKAE